MADLGVPPNEQGARKNSPKQWYGKQRCGSLMVASGLRKTTTEAVTKLMLSSLISETRTWQELNGKCTRGTVRAPGETLPSDVSDDTFALTYKLTRAADILIDEHGLAAGRAEDAGAMEHRITLRSPGVATGHPPEPRRWAPYLCALLCRDGRAT